jgi:phage tail-like protein
MSDLGHPGITAFFQVSLDAVDLGHWTKISGLGVEITTEPRGDSAMTFFQHNLPAHLKYSNITLERPVSGSSLAAMNWISAYHMLPVPTVGQIDAIDQGGLVLMSWSMIGVTPVSWRGPTLDAHANAGAAMEQLVIAHQGFM